MNWVVLVFFILYSPSYAIELAHKNSSDKNCKYLWLLMQKALCYASLFRQGEFGNMLHLRGSLVDQQLISVFVSGVEVIMCDIEHY